MTDNLTTTNPTDMDALEELEQRIESQNAVDGGDDDADSGDDDGDELSAAPECPLDYRNTQTA